jgi:hypothetical protein
MNISKNDKISIAITSAEGVAATSDINGATLDMQGFEGVLMIVTFGVITGGAVTSLKAQQDSAAGMGTAADLEGTAQTIADTDDEKTFYIDLFRPTERYMRLVVDRGTQNAVVASATYIQYGMESGRKAPVTHGTNVSGELHVSPAEGTA